MTAVHWTDLAGGPEVTELVAYKQPEEFDVLVEQEDEVREWDKVLTDAAAEAAPGGPGDGWTRVRLARISAGVQIVRIGACAGVFAYALYNRYNIRARRDGESWRFRLEREEHRER